MVRKRWYGILDGELGWMEVILDGLKDESLWPDAMIDDKIKCIAAAGLLRSALNEKTQLASVSMADAC